MTLLEEAKALSFGLLLGDDSGLSSQSREWFHQAGIQHLTAASGANLGMAAMFAHPITRHWRWPGVMALIFAYLAYWFLSGGSGSLWRATFWSIYGVIARCLGRLSGNFYGIFFLLIANLLVKNEYSRSFGYSLSLLASVGLIFSQVFLSGEKQNALLPQHQVVVKRICATLFTSIFVVLCVSPFIWFFFGEFSVDGAFMTPIASLFVPFFQVLGAVVFGFEPFFKPLSFLAEACLIILFRIFTDAVRGFISFSATAKFALLSVLAFLAFFTFFFRVIFRTYNQWRKQRWLNQFKI